MRRLCRIIESERRYRMLIKSEPVSYFRDEFVDNYEGTSACLADINARLAGIEREVRESGYGIPDEVKIEPFTYDGYCRAFIKVLDHLRENTEPYEDDANFEKTSRLVAAAIIMSTVHEWITRAHAADSDNPGIERALAQTEHMLEKRNIPCILV